MSDNPEDKSIAVSLQQLTQLNQFAYDIYYNKIDAKDVKVDGLNLELIRSELEPESNHGGVSFYDKDNNRLINIHRGSVGGKAGLQKDWINNNFGSILFKQAKETQADLAAWDFSVNSLKQSQLMGYNPDLIIETGHSKGGREAQYVVSRIKDIGVNKCVGVVFNSAPTHPDYVSSDVRCLNFRVKDKNSLFFVPATDLVSTRMIPGHFGQLGRESFIDSSQPHLMANAISSHSLSAVERILNQYPNASTVDVTVAEAFVTSGTNNLSDIEQAIKSNQNKGLVPVVVNGQITWENSQNNVSVVSNDKYNDFVNKKMVAQYHTHVERFDGYLKALREGSTTEQVSSEIDGVVSKIADSGDKITTSFDNLNDNQKSTVEKDHGQLKDLVSENRDLIRDISPNSLNTLVRHVYDLDSRISNDSSSNKNKSYRPG